MKEKISYSFNWFGCTLAVLITVAICLISSSVLAQIEVKTVDDLRQIQMQQTGHYILMNDIDLQGIDWRPIGVKSDWSNAGQAGQVNFKGTLDGNGFSIKNIEVKAAGYDFVGGLFLRICNGAVIKNLGIENVSIEGRDCTGGIAGSMFGNNEALPGVIMENIHVTGSIIGRNEVGGMIGRNSAAKENRISNSYVNAVVTGDSHVGGLIGSAINTSKLLTIQHCYVAGNIYANKSDFGQYAGGLIGSISSEVDESDFNIRSSVLLADTIIAGQPGLAVGVLLRNSKLNLVDVHAADDIYTEKFVPINPSVLLSEVQDHNKAVRIHHSWIRDPYIYLADDDYYYLTGTTLPAGNQYEYTDKYDLPLGNNEIGYKIRIWKSKDLVNWDYVGEPFSIDEGYWANATINPEESVKFEEVNKNKWKLWAPEIFKSQDTWVFVHTSPNPVKGGSNLVVIQGKNMAGAKSFPLGRDAKTKHDPSLFLDTDDTWYLLWGSNKIAKLEQGFNGFVKGYEKITIKPGSKGNRNTGDIGHEGTTMRKIGNKYVYFGTGWSTETADGRNPGDNGQGGGSYNLYYCTADSPFGPFSERRFAGRFLGHGTLFMDKAGNWWCTAFFNADTPPLDDQDIQSRDLTGLAQTINVQGTTLVPMNVRIADDGDVFIWAVDPRYATPGPDEFWIFD